MKEVTLYDTTLRDGMQGQGMSLSAQEKVRVVRALDELGIHFIEAGFPSSNPKELELFEMLAEVQLEQALVCAFGMTRRRDVAAAEDEGLGVLADCFAPVVTLVGKTWGLHLEKVTKVSREENLAMIGDSVAFLVGEGQARHLRRRAFLRRLPRRPGLRARVPARRCRGRGRERHPLRHQRLQPAEPGRRGDRRDGRGARRQGRHPHPQRRRVRGRQLARRGRAGGEPGPGHDQRLRRADRQRQPGLDPARAAAEARLRGRHRRAARQPDRGLAFRRRALQRGPGPRPALRRPQRLRPQGRHARRRRPGRRPHLRAHRSGPGRQRARRRRLRSSPARARCCSVPSGPGSSSTTSRPATPSRP